MTARSAGPCEDDGLRAMKANTAKVAWLRTLSAGRPGDGDGATVGRWVHNTDLILRMLLLAIAVSLGLGPLGAARAADGPDDDGPQMTDAAVDAWIASRLNPSGWRYLYFDADGAYFLSPDAPWKTQENTWRLRVREELFKPDDHGARSMVMDTELDCDGRRLRLPGTEAFTGHNLSGERSNRDPIEDWVSPANPGESAHFDQLCALARTPAAAAIAPQATGAPAPASLQPADIHAWADHYLDLTGWQLVETAPDGLNLATTDGALKTGNGQYSIWTRVEFFRPQAYPAGGPPARSARQRVELDCPDARWRITEVDAFRLNNLNTPEPPFQAPGAQWTSSSTGAPESQTIQRLCAIAEAATPSTEHRRGRHRRKRGA